MPKATTEQKKAATETQVPTWRADPALLEAKEKLRALTTQSQSMEQELLSIPSVRKAQTVVAARALLDGVAAPVAPTVSELQSKRDTLITAIGIQRERVVAAAAAALQRATDKARPAYLSDLERCYDLADDLLDAVAQLREFVTARHLSETLPPFVNAAFDRELLWLKTESHLATKRLGKKVQL